MKMSKLNTAVFSFCVTHISFEHNFTFKQWY